MNDYEIVRLLFERDNDGIKYASELYSGRMQRMAENMLGSKEDAKECVNDALMRVWETIPPNQPDNLYAYIMTLCRNIAYNMIDWKNAKKRSAEIVPLTNELEMCVPDKLTQGDMVDEYALGEIISEFLEGIPKEKRIMFVRRYWYSDDVADIAKRFGCSKGRVNVTLHRVRKDLKKYLEEAGVRV